MNLCICDLMVPARFKSLSITLSWQRGLIRTVPLPLHGTACFERGML